jgi:hypothetical protein
MNDDDDKTLAEQGIDLSAWEPQLPPSDFAERVVRKARAEGAPARSPARSPARAMALGAAAFAAAAAIALGVGLRSTDGDGRARATERREVAIGGRAIAVLEPGAAVEWHGDDVTQSAGDVFYRVSPGGRFVVHTSAGDVEVKGTCFRVRVGGESRSDKDMQARDVKSGAIGAAATALALVAVYEGKVAISHAKETVTLSAGQAATAGPDGVKRVPGEGAAAPEGSAASDDPTQAANKNLVETVSDYKRRLEAIEEQKRGLEKQLASAKDKLEAAQRDGAVTLAKNEFDLSQEDWADLAKTGTIKYRMPCQRAEGWKPSAEKLSALGLAPHDAETIGDAYKRVNGRVWDKVRPLCVQALGSADAVDKIGARTCEHLIFDVAAASDASGAEAAKRAVAEMRAGLRPLPKAGDKLHPVTQLFLVLTEANSWLEQDLTQSFGPAEAHRLAYHEDMCHASSEWGGGPKPK